ncbi:MAG: UDP-N-acetylmuramoyl-tripeptide--D-alanyl-D-alanine ligase [Oscillospiraceae bacterium]|nr:UDP-N-acetylmuramoyl-tripeptide--D-alanyl-D-alanine ligase [Oscillospiraceae bacterium]
MNLTLKQIAEWTHGTVAPEYETVVISDITTDSREVKPGQLFIPLTGEHFDGHDYIMAAMQHCAATLSERRLEQQVPVVYVSDTEKAFGDIARGYRQTLKLKVIGITGSVGKTTTKEMIAGVLAAKYKTAKTEGNHNNQIGLPKTILGIEEDCQAAVLELGMNHFGEMSYLTSIAQPDVAVMTNIGTVHIEHLGSREGILKAKLEITEGISKNGCLILNGDEPLLWNLKGTLPFTMLYFGLENPGCDLRARNIMLHDDGVSFHVEGMRADFEIYVPAPGRHNIYNALAAILVGIRAGIEPQRMQKALANFQNTGMRQKIYEENGFTIIEDCYNAGPESMEAALEVLAQRACSGRRIAVLGDMLELGNCSMAEHYKVGRLAAMKADMVFAYGNNASRIVTGAITGGMPSSRAVHFDSHEQMAKVVRSRAQPGDVLLFKGSRGMRMEHVLSLFLNREGE